jgi:hypothetical protein
MYKKANGAQAAHLWVTEQLVPTAIGDSRPAHLLAAAGRTRTWSSDVHQRMQKALTQMNVQLANVISDVSGLTGQTIIRAIVTGERDPRKLAELRDPRIHASREEIAKSLEGNWRPELLFVLQQEVEMFDTYQRRIAECDQQLQKHLASFVDTVPPSSSQGEPKEKRQNQPRMLLDSSSAANCSGSAESTSQGSTAGCQEQTLPLPTDR